MAGETSGISKAVMERLAGEWHGTFNPPNGTWMMVFRFEIKEDGGFNAFVNATAQGDKWGPSSDAGLVDGNLTLKFAYIGAEYKGKISGDKIVGEWRQGPETIPLNLKKGEYKPEAGDEESSTLICTIQATVAKYDGWYLDFENSRKPEMIDGCFSSRNLLLTAKKVPGVYWRLIRTDQGILIQATAGEYDGWYLDFDNSQEPEMIDGATSSRNLLLTQTMPLGVYWMLTEKSSGTLIQATAAAYDGWYLDFENSREPETVDGEKSSRNLLLSKEPLPGAYWKIVSTNEQSDTGDR
jgi:regulator of RNase E activity RraB